MSSKNVQKTRTAKSPRPPTMAKAFLGKQFSTALQTLRTDVERAGRRAHHSASLEAIEQTALRVRAALQRASRRQAGDLSERLDELDYPIAALRAYFDRSEAALPKRATEIMAEYVRDRLLEIRIVARAADKRR